MGGAPDYGGEGRRRPLHSIDRGILTYKSRNQYSAPFQSNFQFSSTRAVAESKAVKSWLGLALGSLLLGGILSLLVLMGRVPFVNQLLEDPLFAKKALVIHVNLTLGSWSFAFFTALYLLIPGGNRGKAAMFFAAAGIAAITVSGFMLGAAPILSNYFPVLDHPLFFVGLSIFFGAIVFTLADGRLFPQGGDNRRLSGGSGLLPDAAKVSLRVAVIIFFLGIATFLVSFFRTEAVSTPFQFFNTIFWGAGHLFQLVNVAVMMSVWLILSAKILGKPVLGHRGAAILFGLHLLPALFSLYFLTGAPAGSLHYQGYVSIMRWGTWPVATILLLIMARSFYRAGKEGRLTRARIQTSTFFGLFWSAALVVLGFVLGAMIGGSNTLIPAHYHATIGAVTIAYMTTAYLLLEHLGMPVPTPRLKKLSIWQPTIFGVGQFIFAGGFAYAGMHGLGRKYFGQEQTIHTLGEYLSLAVTGVGGSLAIIGGGLFLYIAGRCWFQKT